MDRSRQVLNIVYLLFFTDRFMITLDVGKCVDYHL